MIEFSHVIADAEGLHARPVALICSAVQAFDSVVTISVGNRSCAATDLMGLMGLDARRNDTLKVVIEGPDEELCAATLRKVLTF